MSNKYDKPNKIFHLVLADELFCQKLFAQQHITALPGQYLSRQAEGINPGFMHARLALVATEEECLAAALRIKTFIHSNYK